jgi:predicted metalloenzyme YecM
LLDIAQNLPTFEAGGRTLLKRLTMAIEDGLIKNISNPVHSPDTNADAEITWLKTDCRF